tara:strand:- start:1121 stop:1507 length:387 start_codon:yes stop_codon:yes gene_type:complete
VQALVDIINEDTIISSQFERDVTLQDIYDIDDLVQEKKELHRQNLLASKKVEADQVTNLMLNALETWNRCYDLQERRLNEFRFQIEMREHGFSPEQIATYKNKMLEMENKRQYGNQDPEPPEPETPSR